MLLSLVYINCDYLQAQTTIPRFEEGERVVFVGNSITHGGHYHSFIWLYYMTRFPDKPITIMNAGIGGESAWDMKDRLDYDVFNRKPTYVTLTFGMNDTGYDIYMKDDAKELSKQRIAKSLESYREIEERLLAKNKIKKVLIGGSPYDETSRFNNFILHNKNNAILKIIDAQRISSKKNGWGFVDFNQPMREISRKEQEADSTFTFCRIDRIHPDNDGQMVMAYLFLKAQGLAGDEVSSVSIDAYHSSVITHNNCKISKLKKNGTDLKKYNEKISKPQSLICYSHSPIQYGLTPLKGLYFNKIVEPSGTSFLRGNINHVTILTVVACMLLLVGVFNFINIYTVIVLKRAREFGVKKVYGASGFQIFTQIYVENIYMVAAALLIIWMLIETSAGIFASVYAIPVKPDIAFDLSLSLILLFVLPLVTSVFPFLRYNYSSPITSLRSVNAGGNSIVSRVVFLFIQYVITFSLIVVALFFVRQLYTMLNADLGYQAKNIISCQFLSFETQNRRYANDEEWQKERDLERHKVQVIKQKMDACPLFIS